MLALNVQTVLVVNMGMWGDANESFYRELVHAARQVTPRVLWKTTTRMRYEGRLKWLRTDLTARRVFGEHAEIFDAAWLTRNTSPTDYWGTRICPIPRDPTRLSPYTPCVHGTRAPVQRVRAQTCGTWSYQSTSTSTPHCFGSSTAHHRSAVSLSMLHASARNLSRPKSRRSKLSVRERWRWLIHRKAGEVSLAV